MATKGHLLYFPEGKHDILLGKELNDVLKSKVNSVTKITYQDLKDLRDNSKLTPGSLYRITDYNCTTTQENTRSAGHQFDIVLLALSEDKLAEEGWAMMHESDTPSPEPTGTTYYKWTGYEQSTLREVERWTTSPNPQIDDLVYDLRVESFHLTGKVRSVSEQEVICSDERLYNLHLTTLTEETIFVPDENSTDTNNYFQNSNLSAWKVWYCLDNDKSRFAWAATSASVAYNLTLKLNMYDMEIPCTALRDESKDYGEFKCFTLNLFGSNGDQWIKSDTISVGTVTAYSKPSEDGTTTELTIISVTELPPIKATGVIYRLIDEWNNDFPYDFKNIQFLEKLVPNKNEFSYDDASFTETYVYTFNQSGNIDGSLSRSYFNNICISKYNWNTFNDNLLPKSIPHIVFLGELGWENTIMYSSLIKLCGNMFNNTFKSCNEIILDCYRCRENIFNEECVGIKILSRDSSEDCCHNIFGPKCRNITLGKNCSCNTFKYNNSDIQLGDYCKNNTFDKDCETIHLGDNCVNNTFGKNCLIIHLAENNGIINNMVNCSFGDYTRNLTISNTNTSQENNFISNIIIDTKISNKTINVTGGSSITKVTTYKLQDSETILLT